MLLGFAAALRRSELVALDVEDLRFDLARGLTVTIRKSKTDQVSQEPRLPCRTRARETLIWRNVWQATSIH